MAFYKKQAPFKFAPLSSHDDDESQNSRDIQKSVENETKHTRSPVSDASLGGCYQCRSVGERSVQAKVNESRSEERRFKNVSVSLNQP